jgi:hypothetical protein
LLGSLYDYQQHGCDDSSVQRLGETRKLFYIIKKLNYFMKYIVYLTKNLKSKINGINKIYVGVHKTKNPEIFDGYIGCGVYIQQPSTYMYPKTPF